MNSSGIIKGFNCHNADGNYKHTQKAEKLKTEIKSCKCNNWVNPQGIANDFRLKILSDYGNYNINYNQSQGLTVVAHNNAYNCPGN